WDARDTAYFNGSDYDGLLFVGDLPAMTRGGLAVAREIARLTKPAWLIPGNHDAVTLPQLYAEMKGWRLARQLGAIGMRRRVRRLERTLGRTRLCGYQLETLDGELGLLVARPHAMGPDKFYYRAYLKRRYGIADFEASATTLKQLIDSAPSRLLVLAHNGPAGLGDAADAPWGQDFDAARADFGDPDLRIAIDYARDSGRQVLAVVAGHMHHRGKSGNERKSWGYLGKTLCVNAARVARIRKKNGHRHHISLEIDGEQLQAQTVWLDAQGGLVHETAIG
ncbi:MAG: hypothetical protein L0H19_05185, partial [Salinisphaera sp.]|nr:hypothetical protein [Salinisphaera sp.]